MSARRSSTEDKSLAAVVEDKSLAPAEDKAADTEPVEDFDPGPPADIRVKLVHHTTFGAPGQCFTLPFEQAQSLLIGSRAVLCTD